LTGCGRVSKGAFTVYNGPVTLLNDLVSTSQRVGASSARSAKVRELAAFLRTLEADEVEIAVHYLSGEIPQGRIGIGYSALRTAASSPPGHAPKLTVAELDRSLAGLAEVRGAGSAARRTESLRELFSRATAAEQDFLLRLLAGELRQGALAGVMVDAIAAAADIPVAQIRRAAMYAQSLGLVARVALNEGIPALERFQLELFAPVAPMLAQTATDVGEALTELQGEAAFEWKMDGARIQLHKAGDDVRIYTRSLNEVTAAIPEIVEAARGFAEHTLVLDGEAIAFDPQGRPHPFQITMRRFGRKLNVDSLRGDLPIRAYYFDCLRIGAQSIADLPTTERFAALARAVPAELRVPRLVTGAEKAARGFYESALAAGHEGVMAKSLSAPYEAGNRGASWLKIKRAHTLDLVVLAAEWGHGRRTGKLSNLHLGALDPATGEYVMLGKTFKGLTDALLEWQTREFLAREVSRDRWTVYVRPELVVEIAFSDLQASSRYPGGLALRLARVKRYRDDKRADEADNMDAVRKIYAAQAGGSHEIGAAGSIDAADNADDAEQ
jgi:DNA ligase-1